MDERRRRRAGDAPAWTRLLRRALLLAALAGLALAPGRLLAQPATERTPNLPGPWVTSPWNLHFQFAHRFQVVGADADVSDIFGDGSLVNYPTFDVALGLPADLMTGVRYSSASVLVGGSNEWQPYLKWAPVRGTGDGELSVASTLAWNGAAGSVDGELTARTRAGPVYAIGSLRAFSDVFDLPAGEDDEALALGGGIGVRLTRYLALAVDAGDLVAGPEAPMGWSAGLQIGIPYTPHTLSLQATNVYSGTLQGTVTGDRNDVFWGFEFTVPFSGFARWGRIFGGGGGDDGEPGGRPPPAGGEAEDPPAADAAEAGAAGRVVEVPISGFAFGTAELRVRPGTTVRWVNRDPVGHTSTSDDGVWDSALLGPGESFSRTFREPGRYPYHCTPHPYMEGVVVVTSESERNP